MIERIGSKESVAKWTDKEIKGFLARLKLPKSGKKKEDRVRTLEGWLSKYASGHVQPLVEPVLEPPQLALRALLETSFMSPLKSSRALETGKANEPVVLADIRAFLARQGYEVVHLMQLGLVVRRDMHFMGTSVDGLVVVRKGGTLAVWVIEIKTATGNDSFVTERRYRGVTTD